MVFLCLRDLVIFSISPVRFSVELMDRSPGKLLVMLKSFCLLDFSSCPSIAACGATWTLVFPDNRMSTLMTLLYNYFNKKSTDQFFS